MKSAPLRPGRLVLGDDGVPYSPEHGDVYHPRAGALQQARHVFLAGNGLPARWRGRDDFTILETGFGLGNNLLAAWQAWRDDPERCARLHLISIEKHPLPRDDLARVPRDAALAARADELLAGWPPLVPGMHRLLFEDGRVELLLAFGDVQDWARELVATVDALFLDGFAPARNPAMWSPALLRALARVCRRGATAATWSAARPVRDALASAGFVVQRALGSAGKRDITRAHHAPAFAPSRVPPGRPVERDVERRALIVGGGLAGCAAAWALAGQGWRCRVFDRHPRPAGEASGNAAGLFHGTVHADDGPHARWNRAAALHARDVIMALQQSAAVPGAADGLLRLEKALGVDAMQALLAAQALDPAYVQALDAAAASRLAGIALAHPAWYYPGGGWVAPGRLAAALLAQAGAAAQWSGGTAVAALMPRGGAWALLDAEGRALDEAPTVVLANAHDLAPLVPHGAPPLEVLRGQLSALPLATLQHLGAAAPQRPVAGQGYVLPAIDGQVWFGATSQAGDADATLRAADHRHNLAQLGTLLGRPLPADAAQCTGRVGWRCSTADRLPLIGAWPAPAPAALQPRLVPRVGGLFVFGGLGSRGITWAALGARVLASWVCGAASPVEASLLDAVDPARFAARAARRGGALRARSSPVAAG